MIFIALVIGFVAAIGFSAYAATTISTNVTTDGSIEANADLVVYDDGWIKSGLGIGTSATSTAGSANLSADLVSADDGWFQGGFAVGTAATSTAGSANFSADLVAADDAFVQG